MDVEVGETLAPVVRENAGDRAPLEEYDVAVATAVPCESTTVNRGAEAVDEERARLRLRSEGKRGP